MDFKKRFLALSVAAASVAPNLAVADITIANGQTATSTQFLSVSPDPNITIDLGGTISTISFQQGISVSGVSAGTVINNGTVTADAEALFLGFGGGLTAVTNSGSMSSSNNVAIHIRDGSALVGNLTNNAGGSISGYTGSGSGVAIAIVDNGSVTGNIVNAGTITGSGGFEIAGGFVTGDIINSGTITATEEDYAGIDIFSDTDPEMPSTLYNPVVTGTIINTGTIENTAATAPNGDPSVGLWFDGANIQGGIDNQTGGIIRSQIGEAIVLDGTVSENGNAFARTIVNGITNAGTIQNVAGTESAISVYGAQITGGVNNSGTISGAQGLRISGIRVAVQDDTPTTGTDTETFSQDTTSGITGGLTNSGTITGSVTQTLIDAGNTPLFSSDALDYGTISISHGASIDFLTNSAGGTISNTGVSAAISVGSANDLSGITDPNIVFVGLPFTSVEAGSIGADLTNAGTISSASSAAIAIRNGTVGGGIVNSGTITGDNGGIYVGAGGSIAGGITNSSIISSTGTTSGNLAAIDIQMGATIGGDITNNAGGDINGVEVGFILEDSTMNGDLINNTGATIQSSTGDAVIIRGSSTVLTGSIANSGGTLTGGAGIAIEGGATVTNGIANTGTINGSAVGILLDGSDIGTINNGVGGTIAAGTMGSILASNGGTIGGVDNAGTISGTTDFGAGGGSFFNSSTGTAGDILGVDVVNNFGGTVGDVTFRTNGLFTFVGGGSSGEITGATAIAVLSGQQATGVTTGTINGDLTFNGVLTIDATAASTSTGTDITRNSQLVVTGDADLTGAQVTVLATNIDLFAFQSFTFLDAGGTLTSDISTFSGCDTGSDTCVTEITVTDTSEVLQFEVQQAGNDLIAVIGAIDFTPDLPESVESTTGGENINSVADALTSAITSGGSDIADTSLGEVTNALAGINTSTPEGQAAYVRALASLDVETVEGASVGALSADAAAAGTVNSRVAALRNEYGLTGAIAGDDLAINGFWVQVYDNETDQDIRDGIDGFDADTFGFAIGFDAPITERINAGLAFTYADTDVDAKLEDNEMTIESYRLAAYGSYNADTYYVDAQVAYALNQYDTERMIDPALTMTPLVAKGDHDGDQYSARFRGGYPIALENGLYITPKAEIDYTYLQEDSYDETGAGNVGLSVSSDSVEVLVIGLGVKFAYPITTANEITWIPELSFDYMYDTIGDEVEIDSNFIGVSGGGFITAGASVEQEMYKTSVRLRAFGQGSFSFSGGFDYIEKDDYDSQSIMATVRYDF